ncbi:GNAT family N-acetyltransferase [Caulobacter sp. CCNWLY153]|uniref:GNAT family N-acetyltransferase n=1 Tax=Caulobacter TaxID=75 RepID=UPI001A9C28A3|nr:GNAT family N-acetyltransferase [Caulobacter radicis]
MIDTPRLTLRPHTVDDLAHVVALARDPAVTAFIRGLPTSEEECWHRLLRYAGHWSQLGFGMFAVFERQTGRFVGEAGLADFHRGLGADFDGAPEAAWMLMGWAHGAGLALEAAAAAHAWLEERRPGGRTVCIIDPANLGSIRLSQKLGYAPFRQGVYRDAPVTLFERRLMT